MQRLHKRCLNPNNVSVQFIRAPAVEVVQVLGGLCLLRSLMAKWMNMALPFALLKWEAPYLLPEGRTLKQGALGCHGMGCQAMGCHAMGCDEVPCHGMASDAMGWDAMPWDGMPGPGMPWDAMPWDGMPCHGMARDAMGCQHGPNKGSPLMNFKMFRSQIKKGKGSYLFLDGKNKGFDR